MAKPLCVCHRHPASNSTCRYGGECGVAYESLFQMPHTDHAVGWASYDSGPMHIISLDTGEGPLACTSHAGGLLAVAWLTLAALRRWVCLAAPSCISCLQRLPLIVTALSSAGLLPTLRLSTAS